MSHYANKVAAISLVLGIILTSSYSVTVEGGDFGVDPTVQTRILAHANRKKPANVIKTITGSSTVELNDAKITSTYEVRYDYIPREDGLYQILTTMTTNRKEGASKIGAQTLTLCGLVEILSKSKLRSEFEWTRSGSIFSLPIPWKTEHVHDNESQGRLVSFDTNATNLCTPGPDSAFSFMTETDSTSTSAQNTLSTKTSIEYICKTGKEERPASSLLPALRGNLRSVTCETTPKRPSRVQVEYVYLIDSGLFLEMSRMSSGMKHWKTLSGVEYAQ